MSLDVDDVREILARSSGVFERLGSSFAPDVRGDARALPALVQPRVDRWQQRVSGGSPARFARYLKWRGLDDRLVRRAVAPVRFCGDGWPEWAALLQEATRIAAGTDGPDEQPAWSARLCDPEAPEAFEEAIAPFVGVARARLPAPPADDEATPAARLALERALLQRLARIASPTLYPEFRAFCVERTRADGGEGAMLAHALAAMFEPDRRRLYRAFIASLRGGALSRLLVEYPVLARLLATCAVDWIDATAEFWGRLRVDRFAIERTFAGGAPIGRVTAIVPGLSDPHHGGRTVSRVTFASGLVLMYKPRALGLDAAFAGLVAWLNDGRVSLPLKAAAALDRGTHGWMECVAAASCRDAAGVDRYYRRAGMLLCLAHVLGGADLHHENVMACGEFPVLIDLEVLMSAPVRRDVLPPTAVPHGSAGREVWDSVLRTGLLPIARAGVRGRYRRSGGLVATKTEPAEPCRRWQHVNTDFMRPGWQAAEPRLSNLPHLDTRAVPVEGHTEPLVAGFTAMARALRRHRDELLRTDGVLQPFRAHHTRVVLRDTEAYSALINQLLQPRALRDGAEWGIELELLLSGTSQRSKPRGWRAHVAELGAMWHLDIPRFDAATDAVDLRIGDRHTLPRYLAETGHHGVTTRLRALDDEQLDVDRQSIRVAIQSAAPDRAAAVRLDPAPSLRDDARAIGDVLRRLVYEDARGRLGWLGIRRADAAGNRGIQPVGWDLYGGRCGIAILLAALDRDHHTREPLSLRVLAPLVANGHASAAALQPWMTASLGARGLGGVVYGLVRAAQLLRSDALIGAAERAAAAITPERIDRDDELDVIDGVAGAALGLLALHRSTGHAWVLARAGRCGQHLLDRARRVGRRDRYVWSTARGRTPRGFAHGAAGIGYALACLSSATGVPAYRDAALAAVERPRRRPAGARARDDVSHAAPMTRSWCQGITGITLSCLAVSGLVVRPDLREGLDAVLADLAAPTSLGPFDDVCCGNMGRVELFLTAAHVLGNPRWLTAARALGQDIVARAVRRRNYAVCPVDDVFSPGYYDGLAGLAYGLLRVETPDLPSVLLWE
jgi:type 2 lantibiotic biosynthesis protein LanM